MFQLTLAWLRFWMMFAPSNKPPPGAFARQRVFPRSMTLLSHVRLLWPMQLRLLPPVALVSFGIQASSPRENVKRTIVAAGHAATRLAVGGGAGVLLQTRVGDAAVADGHWAVLILTGSNGGTLRKGSSHGGDAEEDRSESELHVGEVIIK